MADLTPEQAIEKLRTLPEDKQRSVLMQLSPEQRKGILTQLKSGGGTPPKTAPTPNAIPAVLPGAGTDIQQEQERYKRSNPLQRAGSSFDSGFGIPQSVQEHPSEAAKGVGLAVLHPGLEWESLKSMYHGMSKDQQDLIDRAYFDQHQPGFSNKAAGFALGIYSAIPFVGPAIVHALDQWHSGDKAGAVGSLGAVLAQTYRPGEAKVPVEGVGGEMARPGTVSEPVHPRFKAAARNLTEATQGVQDAAGKAIEKQAEALDKNKEARRSTMKENLETDRAAATERDRAKLRLAEENRKIELENKSQADAVAERGRLAKHVDQESLGVKKDLETLEHDVWQEANKRMDAVKPTGNPQAPPDTLIGTVKDIEKNTLNGIPENIKEFRRILGMEATDESFVRLRDDVAQGYGFKDYASVPDAPARGAAPGSETVKAQIDRIIDQQYGGVSASEPLTWEKLQSLKSRIDARLRNTRGMNGDLKRGLFAARDGIVDEMGKMLQQPGQSPTAVADWQSARDFYRQFKEDFHEPAGRSGSGSPIAQALDAVDPARIRKPLSGDAQARAGQTLRKYAQFGGDKLAGRVEGMTSAEKTMKSLPEEEKPKALKKASEVHQLPEHKELPKVPEKPTVDVDAISRQKILSTAQRLGRLNAWDARIIAASVIGGVLAPFMGVKGGIELGASYVAMKYYLSKSLRKPEVLDWISKTPADEIDILNKMPGSEKINIKHGLTEAAMDVAGGKKITMSPRLREFLGPENVRRLVQAGAISAVREKKPAEQIQDLNKIRESYSSNPALPVGEERR